jgi:serpin B
MFKFLVTSFMVLLPMLPLLGQSQPAATNTDARVAVAINAIGVDLLHQTGSADANALLSPYSIESALSMAYAGADGATRDEMARVLHLQGDGVQVAKEFAALRGGIDGLVQRSVEQSNRIKKFGGSEDPITLDVANRLFGQRGYDFRPAFLELVGTNYDAPLQAMDFIHDAAGATKTINDWVEQKTNQRIRDLIPNGALDRLTRLVLVNAVYLKAAWANRFVKSATKPLPFHVSGGAGVDVPTMSIQKLFGYAKTNGVTVVSLPYSGGELQFLIILPDDVNGLTKVEAELTADELGAWATLPSREVKLYLPRFKIEPPTLPLGDALQKLGMATAFDNPRGSANFDRMAPRRPPNDYLYISKVLHKGFLSVDEKGTEAAAATAVVMVRPTVLMRPIEPLEVKVDRPFLFAVQHRASGACLFLGHVVDPRATGF